MGFNCCVVCVSSHLQVRVFKFSSLLKKNILFIIIVTVILYLAKYIISYYCATAVITLNVVLRPYCLALVLYSVLIDFDSLTCFD